MPIFDLNITSTTQFNGKYAFQLGSIYGWVYWNSALNRWENGSNLGYGTLYNYLPSTQPLPTTSPTQQWVNVTPGFEIFACIVGDCEDNICFYGYFSECQFDEVPAYYHCNTFVTGRPLGTTSNGYLYYRIETPGGDIYYVWYSTDESLPSPAWVMGSTLEDITTVIGSLTSPIDPDRPIGNWEVGESVANMPLTSYFECTSTLCVKYFFPELGISTLIFNPYGLVNGKISYYEASTGFLIYWDNEQELWLFAVEEAGEFNSVIGQLEYQGEYPLSGIFPDNHQWQGFSELVIPVFYSSIGELDSTQTDPHGPCYLPVCFNYIDEAFSSPPGSCLTYPMGVYNSKPYYILQNPNTSCTTNINLDGNDVYVWWDETNSRWVSSLGTGDLTTIINNNLLTTSNDELYPSGTWTSNEGENGPIIGFSTIGECTTAACCTPTLTSLTETESAIFVNFTLDDTIGCESCAAVTIQRSIDGVTWVSNTGDCTSPAGPFAVPDVITYYRAVLQCADSSSEVSNVLTFTPTTTTTTQQICECIEYYNNTQSTITGIFYTDCSTQNPVGPVSVETGNGFCTSTAPTGTNAGFLNILGSCCG